MTRISSGPDRLANWLGRHLGSPRVLSETQLRRRELAVATSFVVWAGGKSAAAIPWLERSSAPTRNPREFRGRVASCLQRSTATQTG